MRYLLAFHLIAIVCWFAGLFYLPRLFVYHATTTSQAVKDQFKIMEYKLYWFIMMPAMVIVLLTGMGLTVAYLSTIPAHPHVGWLGVKALLVLILICFHAYCQHCLNAFQQDHALHSARFFRYFNEIPSVLLVVIVLLAFVKPL